MGSSSGGSSVPILDASRMVYTDGTGTLVVTAAPTHGQLLIGQTGGVPVLGTLTGTANQITVTNGAGSITLSTPQNIHTSADPTFRNLNISTTVHIGSGTYNNNYGIKINDPVLAGVDQMGLLIAQSYSSSATTSGTGVDVTVGTDAAAFTMPNLYGMRIQAPTIGAGSTITALYGLKIENQTGGGTNYAIYTGTGDVRFGGATTIAAGGLTVSAGGASVTGTTAITGATTITNTATSGGLVALVITQAAHTAVVAEKPAIQIDAATLTITGAIASYAWTKLSAPTFTAGTAQTIMNAYTLYVSGAPVAAGSAVITTSYALYVAGGKTYFGSDVSVKGATIGPSIVGLRIRGTTSENVLGVEHPSDTSINVIVFGVGAANQGLITLSDGTGTGKVSLQSATDSYFNGGGLAIGNTSPQAKLHVQDTSVAAGRVAFRVQPAAHSAMAVEKPAVQIDAATLTLADTTTIASYAWVKLSAPTFNGVAAGGAEVITDAYTLYVSGAPIQGTDITVTNPYSLFVAGGNARLDGNVGLGAKPGSSMKLDVRGNASITGPNTSLNSAIILANVGASAGTTGDLTATSGSLYGFVSEPVLEWTGGAGTSAASIATWLRVRVADGVTVAAAYGIFIDVVNKSTPATGVVTDAYGLYVKTPTAGTNNYAGYFEGKVGIGVVVPLSPLHVRQDQNAITSIRVVNATNGTAAAASLYVIRDNTAGMAIYALSAGYTTSGLAIANSGLITTDADLTGGIVINVSGVGPLIFGTSNAKRWEISNAGHLLAGTDNQVDIGAPGATRPRHGYFAGELTSSFLNITDGVSAPGFATGLARIYVDSADGDLKVVFADGVIKTLAVDT